MNGTKSHSQTHRKRGETGLFACLCCGYATLATAAGFEICPICFWEDDGQDDARADEALGGPNRSTLTAARIHFLRFGAADPASLHAVRAPTPKDEKLQTYRLVGDRLVTDTLHRPASHPVDEAPFFTARHVEELE